MAGNYYPVNSLISLDDGTHELTVVTDVTMGGSSMQDGQLEIMPHRRCQADDHRGVQEPLNETMCGCNDIGAEPGKMGANGHEGDGGCLCEGLTMRGSVFVVLDTMVGAHAIRRKLVEQLNFPPTLAFAKGAAIKSSVAAAAAANNNTTGTTAATTINNPSTSMSFIARQLPPNVKLQTITSNYKAWNDQKLLLRFAHMYGAGEHPTLSMPANFSLSAIFATAQLNITSAAETMLTANQGRAAFEAKKLVWPSNGNRYPNTNVAAAHPSRVVLDVADASMTVSIRPMEVKTYLVTLG